MMRSAIAAIVAKLALLKYAGSGSAAGEGEGQPAIDHRELRPNEADVLMQRHRRFLEGRRMPTDRAKSQRKGHFITE
jgi:hypothetical protein